MGIAFGEKGKGYPEMIDYVVDVEHRKTIEEINEIKERWEKSGRYYRIVVDKTKFGFCINGFKRVKPYII